MADSGNHTSPLVRGAVPNSEWSAQRPRQAPRGLPPEGFYRVGRYGLCEKISSGGMASVHLGFLIGTGGFSRLVALKRMHPDLAQDPSLAARFKDELLLGARIQHPNVVQALDVVSWGSEQLLVMEYIHGENLAGLVRAAANAGEALPVGVALGVVTSALHGLHAAHEAVDHEGVPLRLVHRDFSPQNVLVGADGHARVLDFGVAQSMTQSVVTQVGQLAGKLPYMAPEQLRGETVDRRSDVFSAGVVLWEALTGRRLFGVKHADSAATLLEVLAGPVPSPSDFRRGMPADLDAVIARALNRDPAKRFATAREFALALDATGAVAGPVPVANCVRAWCADRLQELSEQQTRCARAAACASNREWTDFAQWTDPLASADGITAATVGTGAAPPEPVTLNTTSTRRASRLQWAAIGGVLIAGAIGLLWWRFDGTERVTAVRTSLPNESAVAAVRPQPLPATSSPSADPAAARPIAQHVEPPAASLGSRDPTPKPIAREPARSLQRVRAAVHSPVESACSQPTYLDERGIRHFKEGCL